MQLSLFEHAERMTHNHEWGTQTDIMATALRWSETRPDAMGSIIGYSFKSHQISTLPHRDQ